MIAKLIFVAWLIFWFQLNILVQVLIFLVQVKYFGATLNFLVQVKYFGARLNGEKSSYDYAKRPLQIFPRPSNDWKFLLPFVSSYDKKTYEGSKSVRMQPENSGASKMVKK